jgi:plasmid stabilization system protein ParE
MAKYHIEIQPLAKADVNSIYDWIAERSQAGAVRWYGAYSKAIVRVSKNPLQFGLALEGLKYKRNVRACSFKTPKGRRYRIIFLLHGDRIVVLRVCRPGHDILPESELPH